MKIYTRAGDSGETGLFGGDRVHKDDERVHAYGSVDELNSQIGMALALTQIEAVVVPLTTLQSRLFDLGSELATPIAEKVSSPKVSDADVLQIETWIDLLEKDLEPLKAFILPGGSPTGAALHVARTICRRAERDVVTLGRGVTLRPEVFRFLNRLSDYLFVLARFANHISGQNDIRWIQEE